MWHSETIKDEEGNEICVKCGAFIPKPDPVGDLIDWAISLINESRDSRSPPSDSDC